MDAPAVAVSADGKTIAVAWMDERAGRGKKDLFWRVGRDGKFGVEQPLPDAAEGLQTHPALAIDGSGVVHAVWEDGRAAPTRIYYASSAKPQNVALSDEGRCGFPSVACGPDFVAVAYETDGERVVCRVLPRP